MRLITILLSFLVSITPPQDFICNGIPLKAIIYNNISSSYQVLNDLNDLDEGAFIVLKLDETSIMIPRTFNKDEISFTDKKWWWSYKLRETPVDVDHPYLRRRKPNGEIENFQCISEALSLKNNNVAIIQNDQL